MKIFAILALLVVVSLAKYKAPRAAVPAAVPAAAPAAGECALNAGDDATCTTRALKFCGPKTTSAFTTCRTVYHKFCTAPAGVPDVESCLRERCDTLQKDQWHTYGEKRDACRGGDGNGGVTALCQEHVCVPQTEAPAPQTTAAPAAGECALNAGDDATCTTRALKFCGPKTTSAFTTCRTVYHKFCTAPAGVPDVESCLRERCDTLQKDQWHTYGEKRDACRGGDGNGGVTALCQEHVCVPQTTAAPQTEAPAPQTTAAPQTEAPAPQTTAAPQTDAPAPQTTAARKTYTRAPTPQPEETEFVFLPHALEAECADCDVKTKLVAEIDELKNLAKKLTSILAVKGVKAPAFQCN